MGWDFDPCEALFAVDIIDAKQDNQLQHSETRRYITSDVKRHHENHEFSSIQPP